MVATTSPLALEQAIALRREALAIYNTAVETYARDATGWDSIAHRLLDARDALQAAGINGDRLEELRGRAVDAEHRQQTGMRLRNLQAVRS